MSFSKNTNYLSGKQVFFKTNVQTPIDKRGAIIDLRF